MPGQHIPSRSLIARIRQNFSAMRPSEKKVADYVLKQPAHIIQMRIVDLASEVKVSEPTVIRFCRAVDCDGFQAFKLKLAQEVTEVPLSRDFLVSENDTPIDFSYKVFDSTIDTLKNVRDTINPVQLEKAISALSTANRIEFYGFGASAAVAIDAQHKFFRLQMVTAAYSDPHLQNMSAVSLTPEDVVVAISQSGKTRDLLNAITLVKESGAKVISLSPSGSPVDKLADISLEISVEEQLDRFSPLPSRIAHMVTIDVLAVGVAQHQGSKVIEHLNKLDKGLKSLRT